MINKINAILLSLLLVLPTFGVAIEKHFCGGHLADVALFTGASCGCDDAGENGDCCYEEDLVFTMNLDQIGGGSQRIPEITEHDLLESLALNFSVPRFTEGDSWLLAYDLPPPKTVPSYLLNCSFTFYG